MCSVVSQLWICCPHFTGGSRNTIFTFFHFLIFSHFTFSEADLIFSQRFPLATSIVSRRSSRSYSHQTFWRPVRSASLTRVKITKTMFCQTTIAWGVVGGARYARRSHYQTARYRNAFCQRWSWLWNAAIWRTTSPMSTTTTQLLGATDGEGKSTAI